MVDRLGVEVASEAYLLRRSLSDNTLTKMGASVYGGFEL